MSLATSMSLTTKTMLDLKDKSFDKLYASAPQKYTAMANLAVDFVYVRGNAGDKVLLGDVAEILRGGLEINPAFIEHLRERKLALGSWSLDFAEYILEQVYPQPELKAAGRKI
jgi:hypothetical protein